MATEQTIVGILHSPVDSETGERKRILIQTTTDNVLDPKTGKALTETIAANTYTDATETNSGLMSPTYVKNIKQLMSEEQVISEDNPNRACVWLQIDDEETSST